MLSVGVGTSIHPSPGPGAALLTHSQANGVDILVGAGGASSRLCLPPSPLPHSVFPEFGAVQQQVAIKKFCNRIKRKEKGTCGGMAMIISDTSRAWQEGTAQLSHPPAAWACRLSLASRSSVSGAQCWRVSGCVWRGSGGRVLLLLEKVVLTCACCLATPPGTRAPGGRGVHLPGSLLHARCVDLYLAQNRCSVSVSYPKERVSGRALQSDCQSVTLDKFLNMKHRFSHP